MEGSFARYIHGEGITFKYAKGRSVQSGREFHVYHEIIFFMRGHAEFITEEIHMDISPGTVIVIPKETYHHVAIQGDPEDYGRCTLHFEDLPALLPLIDQSMTASAVLPTDGRFDYLFQMLIGHLEDENADRLVYAVLTLLLQEIAEKRTTAIRETSQNPFIRTAVQYIHRKITIQEIAKECMISPSSLSHIFKKEMNIPLHKFIVKKRLINAYHKILAGEPVTAAAMECGFHDYSGFYKQYKKMFHVKPSEKITELKKP